MRLVHGDFTWITHMLSIIDEETHNLQQILKTFDRVFVFPKYTLSINLYTEISSHRYVSDKVIEGDSTQA